MIDNLAFVKYRLKNYCQVKILQKQKMIIVSCAINYSNINSIVFNADNTASIASFRSNFKNSKWRWLALVLISLMPIGNYFCFDMPNILSTQIKELVTHEVNSENTIKYNQLYSFVSYPNIVLPLIGGIMASKLGLYKIMVSFSLFIIVGQLIFTAAGFFGTSDQNDNMPFIIAIVGRTIYGLGGEVLGVCQYTMISKWFKEKELSLSLSITLSVTWSGGIIWSLIVPPLVEATSLSIGLACGLWVCVFSFISWISLIILDKYADRVDNIHDDFEDDEDAKFHWRDIKQFDRSYWLVQVNFFYIILWHAILQCLEWLLYDQIWIWPSWGGKNW